MNIYIAAPWSIREDLPGIAQQFVEYGHRITHKWWEEKDLETSDQKMQAAIHDWTGVVVADTLVLLNTEEISTGKAIEQGIALGQMKPILAIGKPSSVFHYLPNYKWVDDIQAALTELTRVTYAL